MCVWSVEGRFVPACPNPPYAVLFGATCRHARRMFETKNQINSKTIIYIYSSSEWTTTEQNRTKTLETKVNVGAIVKCVNHVNESNLDLGNTTPNWTVNTQCVISRTSASWTRRCASHGLSWRLDLSLVHRLGDNVTRNAKLIMNGTVAQRYTESSFHRIVFASIIIRVEKLFKPLQEFKIVLEPTLYQFINRDDLQKFRENWKMEIENTIFVNCGRRQANDYRCKLLKCFLSISNTRRPAALSQLCTSEFQFNSLLIFIHLTINIHRISFSVRFMWCDAARNQFSRRPNYNIFAE